MIASYEWISVQFQNTPEGLWTADEQFFIDLTASGEI